MDVDRTETLHQTASEHYLRGEYAEAMEAWRELLALDPAHEPALEGVRMCTLLSQSESVPEGPPGATAMFPPPAAAHDPARQSEGIDFGDLSALEAIPVAAGIPPVPDPAHEFTDAPTLQEDFGLAPVERSQIRNAPPPGTAGAASALSDAADAELRNRIRDLLDEARTRGDAGNIDEAIAVLSRVFILDDDNAEARDLESELRSRAESGVADIESWLVEGIQAFEASRHEDARRWFNNVLERIPDHREALHYLEKIEAASAPHDGSFGGGQGAEPGKPPAPQPSSSGHLDLTEDPLLASIPIAFSEEAPHPAKGAPGRPVRPTPSSRVDAKPKGRHSLPALKPLMLGAAVLAAVGGAYVAYTVLSPSAAPARTAALPRPAAAGTTPTPVAPAETAPAAPRPAISFAEAMNRGRRSLEARDFAAAIVAFNQAVQIDPTHEQARQGMEDATEAYKVKKAEDEQILRIRDYFEENEYSSALRVLYRLPDSVDKAKVDRWKVNGWYNKGVSELLGAECRDAKASFDEALAIDAGDEGVRRLAAFAEKNLDLAKDRAYYAKVEAIGFRKLDD